MANPIDQIPRGTLIVVLSIVGSVLLSVLSFWVRDINTRVRDVEIENTIVKATQITISERLVRIENKLDAVLYDGAKSQSQANNQ